MKKKVLWVWRQKWGRHRKKNFSGSVPQFREAAVHKDGDDEAEAGDQPDPNIIKKLQP
jgi:hypothetical protein